MKMTPIKQEEFNAIARDPKHVVCPATMVEPPCTTVHERPPIASQRGKQVALARWYDGSDYHGGKQPEFYKVEETE